MVKSALLLAFGLVGMCQCYMELLKPYDVNAAMMFHAEDHNQDGVMTKDELEASFDKFDTNGNGKESRHEYTEYVCAANPKLYLLAHYLYDEYDMDNDHTLERHDYDNFFDAMDTDGDGNVTEQEFVTHWVALYTKYEGMEDHKELHIHGHSACH